MCTACDKLDTKMASGRRKRLWDLNSGWHCSILGTCLTLSDLRALGRKLSLHTRAGEPQDYQFHGYFVKEACEPKRPAKLLNKLLNGQKNMNPMKNSPNRSSNQKMFLLENITQSMKNF